MKYVPNSVWAFFAPMLRVVTALLSLWKVNFPHVTVALASAGAGQFTMTSLVKSTWVVVSLLFCFQLQLIDLSQRAMKVTNHVDPSHLNSQAEKFLASKTGSETGPSERLHSNFSSIANSLLNFSTVPNASCNEVMNVVKSNLELSLAS